MTMTITNTNSIFDPFEAFSEIKKHYINNGCSKWSPLKLKLEGFERNHIVYEVVDDLVSCGYEVKISD